MTSGTSTSSDPLCTTMKIDLRNKSHDSFTSEENEIPKESITARQKHFTLDDIVQQESNIPLDTTMSDLSLLARGEISNCNLLQKKPNSNESITKLDSDNNQNESQETVNTHPERISFTEELLGIRNMWSDAPLDDNPNPSPFAVRLPSNHDSSQFGESTG